MDKIQEYLKKLSPSQRDLFMLRLKKQKNRERQNAPKTIFRQNRETGFFPLSFAQQRIWFLDQLESESVEYNFPMAFHISGPLHETMLNQSLNEIVRRHEALRTTFSIVDDKPVQVIAPSLKIPLEKTDLQHLPDAGQSVEVKRLAVEEARQSFDLNKGPLIRFRLLLLGVVNHILLMTVHHIVFDGWSKRIFFKELSLIYEAFSKKTGSPFPEPDIQYVDFALWQNQRFQDETIKTQLNYWKQRLAGAPPLLTLPTDRPRASLPKSRVSAETFTVNPDLVKKIRSISNKTDTTLFMTLFAAFTILLSRYSNLEDLVIGAVTANRSFRETEGIIGFFVNTIMLRIDLSENPDFLNILDQVRRIVLEAFDNQDISFQKLVEELHPERNLKYTPLFQVMFTFQNLSKEKFKLQNLTVTPLKLNRGVPGTNYDLTLAMEEEDSEIRGVLEYNMDLFNASTINRMIIHFQNLLHGIVSNPEQRFLNLPLLTEEERKQILVTWNDTTTNYPKDSFIHKLFEAQADKTPNAPAVEFENDKLIYKELNSRANQLAHHLRTLGVGPEVIVAICMERSLDMIIGLLGILKAGGAYMPLDPDHPKDRLVFMMDNAQTPILLTQEKLLDELPKVNLHVVAIDREWRNISQSSSENPRNSVKPENLAYVIYTSGSTGKPKGVMNTHEGISNRLLWMQDAYQLNATDNVMQKTPFCFDVSVWEFFWPLFTGARLVIAQPGGHKDCNYLVKLILEQNITVLHFVPSMLQVFQREPGIEKCRSLKRVICSGETLTVEIQDHLFKCLPNVELCNLYGPTEAAVDVTHWSCKQKKQSSYVPIGHPIANTQIYILDHHLHPVPIGVTGELHIGGIALARGYLNLPELTKEKFINNPFNSEDGSRIYKTGDLARYLPDGSIEFLGRIDHQVKIRGFRIELGEIEWTLIQHPSVEEAVVLCREDVPGDRRLVAYVVKGSKFPPAVGDLRRFIKQRLPDHMVPVGFVVLDELPLSSNGKVNRKALPQPDKTRISPEDEFIPPRTPTEQTLTLIWAEVLQTDKVGIKDNFFDLGGQSLMATQLVSRIRRVFQIEFPLSQIFENPAVIDMAQRIEGMRWAIDNIEAEGGGNASERQEGEL